MTVVFVSHMDTENNVIKICNTSQHIGGGH